MQKRKNFLPKKFIRTAVALLLMVSTVVTLAGCSGNTSEQSTEAATSALVNESPPSSADLYCHEFVAYSGVFVEDGKNTEVTDVAAILVENRSKIFLDRATIKYKYGDEIATFVVAGLPAGKKCWVLEARKMVLDGKHEFVFEDCVSAFKDDAVLDTDKISVETKDNCITVKNTSMKDLKNVCVYYKNTYDDGNYLGGIAYMMVFDSLKPGESFTKESAHFSEASEIVRYSFQEESDS